MFIKDTVLILGAGASKPYGYPLGRDLIEHIINDIDDKILVPESSVGRGIVQQNNLPDLIALLNELNYDSTINPKKQSCAEIHLYELYAPFDKLKTALNEFSPVSIDAFLRDNPSHEKAGKFMIVYSLLKRENKEKFKLAETEKKSCECQNLIQPDHWYPYLINDIYSGCSQNPNKVINNKLTIITFNYDVSLDYFIKEHFSKTEIFSVNGLIIEQVPCLEILHVYGTIRDKEDITEYGKFYEENPDDKSYLNSCRFSFSLKQIDSIKTIRQTIDQDPERDKIVKLIRDAQEIIIIGFGFDRDNLDYLEFGNSISDYTSFIRQPGTFEGNPTGSFDNKSAIKYMDYNGEMNSVYEDMKSIQKEAIITWEKYKKACPQTIEEHSPYKYPFKLIRSPATSIVSAYQNDFKISLLTKS